MQKVMSSIKRSALLCMVFVLSSVMPLSVATGGRVLAEESTDTSTTQPSTDTPSTTTTPTEEKKDEPKQGPTKPTGADSSTYHYNETTGCWENEHYIWDPATNQTRPKEQQTYSYNPTTGMWDTTEWRYSPAGGTYEPNVISYVQAPAGAKTINSADDENPHTSSNNDGVKAHDDSNLTFNSFYDASISNRIISVSTTGNAGVFGNTLGGSATSGNATDVANVFNLLQSAAGFLGNGDITTFVSNIDGDVVGDLYLDPSALASLQGSSNTGLPSNVDVNVQNNGQINNDIDLTAQTGNAAVQNNTTGGSATSGNANAVANVVNMINSLIGAQKSFLGMININGNLNGDILLPPDLLNTLIASNNIPKVDPTTVLSAEVLANLNNSQQVNNNVNANAATGEATVANNTSAGSATTGAANTNVTILNLTGRQVIGSNALLVFVNVLGSWVGLIMDAPNGSTAAALGGGITQNDIASGTYNLNDNNEINNNINVNAFTGDATVSDNTNAGNATTGNATASANIANVINSQMSLSGWMGILFINVFGTWHGSFGVNTDAGNAPAPAAPAATGAAAAAAPQVFSFVPKSTNNYTAQYVNNSDQQVEQSSDISNQNIAVLGTTDATPPASSATQPGTTYNWMYAVVAIFIALVLFGTEKLIRVLRERKYIITNAI